MSVFGADRNSEPPSSLVVAPPRGFYFCGQRFFSDSETEELLKFVDGYAHRGVQTNYAESDVEITLHHNGRCLIRGFGEVQSKLATKYYDIAFEHVRQIADGVGLKARLVEVLLRKSNKKSNEDWHWDSSDAHSRVIIVPLSAPAIHTQFRMDVDEEDCPTSEVEAESCGRSESFTYFSNNICHQAPTMEERQGEARVVFLLRFDFFTHYADESGETFVEEVGPPRHVEIRVLHKLYA